MFTYTNKFISRIFNFKFLVHAISLALLIGAQTGFSQIPVVTVQLTNPEYDCSREEYCVDAEFLSNEPGTSVFAMNIRFFYDDSILEFVSFSDFQGGYAAMTPNPPYINTSNSAGPAMFNFAGPATFVNGAMQLANPSAPTILLDSVVGTMLFRICFTVDGENVDPQSFCPSIVLDLEADPSNGGYLGGSEGIVITVEDPGPLDSQPSTENVVQFNWMYTGSGTAPFGEPVEEACIAYGSLECAIVLPLSITCRTNNTVIKSTTAGGCGALSYAWTVQGGGATIRSGQGTPQITISVGSAPATVVLMVTDAAGNLAADTEIIRCVARRGAEIITEAVPAEVEWDLNFQRLKDYDIKPKADNNLQQFNLWPNPANETINLSWTSAFDDKIQVQLSNSVGQLVLTDQIAVVTGHNLHVLNVANLPDGSYMLVVQNKLESQVKNVIILRK